MKCVHCGGVAAEGGECLAIIDGVGPHCTGYCIGQALTDAGNGIYKVRVVSVGWLKRLAGASHYVLGEKTLCGLDPTSPVWDQWYCERWGEIPKPCKTCLRILGGGGGVLAQI